MVPLRCADHYDLDRSMIALSVACINGWAGDTLAASGILATQPQGGLMAMKITQLAVLAALGCIAAAGCNTGPCDTEASVVYAEGCHQQIDCDGVKYRWGCACDLWPTGKCACSCSRMFNPINAEVDIPHNTEGRSICSYGASAARQALVDGACHWMPGP